MDSMVWDPQRQQALRMDGIIIIVIIIIVVVVVFLFFLLLLLWKEKFKRNKGVSNSSVRES
jgi:heme/copper-type cytochrome/quinol oxidase subunit 2